VTSIDTELAQVPMAAPAGRANAERHWPLSRVFTVGAAVTAVIVLLVLGSGGYALWRLVTVRTVAAQVGTPGLITGQQLSVALVNEESGVRGFAATGRPEFLEPYLTGVQDERDAMTKLRALAPRGLRDFAPELDAVAAAVAAWRADYVQPVLDRAPVPPSVDLGKQRFDQVRAASATLLSTLDAQRREAAAGADAAVAFLIVVASVIAAVLVGFVVITGIGLRRAVLRPVSELAAEVREVASGALHREVRAVGPREIVELGADVDAMRARILHDLDEAKATNQRLDEQAQDLERSNRDLEQFAYVASHDLQEPLRKVSSFCQLLQRRYGGQLDERADQYIGFAVDGAQRMQQLINDLLAFSRVGRTTEGFERVDMNAVAKAAAAQLDAMRAEVDGSVELGELPVVNGDRALLRQLLINLVGNGLKFGRPDVPPQVRVQAFKDGVDWQLEVVDNGIGIEPEYADKVFVIFQRLHNRDSYPGTGIGLALAKKIVEFHGGRIGIVPTGGPGTTIRFSLPGPTED
jgi:signal transduction histidine kinase